MRPEPCLACGKPIDLDDNCRHLPDPPQWMADPLAPQWAAMNTALAEARVADAWAPSDGNR